jgi:unspecific peroxygenase
MPHPLTIWTITMRLVHFLGFSTLTFVSVVTAFPPYGSLAGLSIEERDLIISGLQYQKPHPPPGPLSDTSAKLVNDKHHPYEPLKPGDIRGPCPGLNTLASHGVRPAQNPISISI